VWEWRGNVDGCDADGTDADAIRHAEAALLASSGIVC